MPKTIATKIDINNNVAQAGKMVTATLPLLALLVINTICIITTIITITIMIRIVSTASGALVVGGVRDLCIDV